MCEMYIRTLKDQNVAQPFKRLIPAILYTIFRSKPSSLVTDTQFNSVQSYWFQNIVKIKNLCAICNIREKHLNFDSR